MSNAMLDVRKLRKSFTLHLRGGVTLDVLRHATFSVNCGDCVVLDGASGSGKSTLLRCLYGNYLPQGGQVMVRHRYHWVDMRTAAPRTILAVRRETIGYVSQFLRTIPRVSARDLVAEPLRIAGVPDDQAAERAAALLLRLGIPQRLWNLPPATFSGGEQQRVNIARGFIAEYPVLLLDEPTASLDDVNRGIVVELIREARDRGTAIVGIFHDEAVRGAVCNRLYDVREAQEAA